MYEDKSHQLKSDFSPLIQLVILQREISEINQKPPSYTEKKLPLNPDLLLGKQTDDFVLRGEI